MSPQPQDEPSANSLLTPGVRVGGFRVIRAGEQELVLRARQGVSIGLMVGGLLLGVWGAIEWIAAFRHGFGTVPLYLLALPFIGLFMVGGGIAQYLSLLVFDGTIHQLGSRLITEDQKPGAKEKTRRFGTYHTVEVEILPNNLNQRETCIVRVLSPGSTPARPDGVMIGRRRTNQDDVITLLAGARRMATLLNLPLVCKGEMQIAPEKVKAACNRFCRDRAESEVQPA
jgi:hypothetical protein